jgi:hypothetical protein
VVKVEAVFSREGDPRRRYVQDAIVQRADEVWNLIQNQHANILYAAMPTPWRLVFAPYSSRCSACTLELPLTATTGSPGCEPTAASSRTSGEADDHAPPAGRVAEPAAPERQSE